MKVKNLIFLTFSLLLILFIFNSCNLYHTYSKKDFMKINQNTDKPDVDAIEDLLITQKQEDQTAPVSVNHGGIFDLNTIAQEYHSEGITFFITNNGNTPLKLTGVPDKIIIDNTHDFELLETAKLPDQIAPGDSGLFKLRFTQDDETDKSGKIVIPNSFGIDYLFEVTYKASPVNIIKSFSVYQEGLDLTIKSGNIFDFGNLVEVPFEIINNGNVNFIF